MGVQLKIVTKKRGCNLAFKMLLFIDELQIKKVICGGKRTGHHGRYP
jgi:hypothetical protein